MSGLSYLLTYLLTYLLNRKAFKAVADNTKQPTHLSDPQLTLTLLTASLSAALKPPADLKIANPHTTYPRHTTMVWRKFGSDRAHVQRSKRRRI